jgi:hypothetical protein
MNIAEQDRMFLSMIDRIFPDQEYTNDEDSVCFRPKTFFTVPFCIEKYQNQGISGRDPDLSTIFQDYVHPIMDTSTITHRGVIPLL